MALALSSAVVMLAVAQSSTGQVARDLRPGDRLYHELVAAAGKGFKKPYQFVAGTTIERVRACGKSALVYDRMMPPGKEHVYEWVTLLVKRKGVWTKKRSVVSTFGLEFMRKEVARGRDELALLNFKPGPLSWKPRPVPPGL